METDHITEILDRNPSIDRDALERAEQAAKQLADVGIKLGGYRLEPPLGGPRIKLPGPTPRRSQSR